MDDDRVRGKRPGSRRSRATRMAPAMAGAAAVLALALGAPATRADPCSVPGTHPSVQQAIDDVACTAIELAAGSYEESLAISRSLSLAGAGSPPSTLLGQVSVSGAGTLVVLADLLSLIHI